MKNFVMNIQLSFIQLKILAGMLYLFCLVLWILLNYFKVLYRLYNMDPSAFFCVYLKRNSRKTEIWGNGG